MKEYFDNLSPREQRIVIVGGIAALILLPYLLFWQPFVDKIAAMEKRIGAQRQELSWMRAASREVDELRGVGGTAGTVRGGQSLLGLIEQTARQAKLGGMLKKVQPDGETGARVWLEDVAFDDMLKWFDSLSAKGGVRVIELAVDRQDAVGRVDARVLLELPGA
jgi:general secretion pathway protein M